MRIKVIEQWKFRLLGRAVPVVKCSDIDKDGRVYTLELIKAAKKRPNSIIATWDSKGWEIDKTAGKIALIDDKGSESYAFVVSESGQTVPLYTKRTEFPNREDVIGKASTMDDIADAMDLGKSLRNMAIGLFVGIGIGVVFIAPILNAMMK